MTILIVEDDELKTERVRNFLMEISPESDIDVARSYKSGLRSLVMNPPDLAIFDMTLPTFDVQPGTDGGRPMSLGGHELLRQMKRRGLVFPVAVVTGFDRFGSGPDAVTLARLDARLSEEFSGFYLGSVYFNAATDEWREHLHTLIHPIL